MWMFAEYCKSEERLDGKTVVITGGTRGIGKEVVRDFYQRGARVIIACRNLELGRKTIDEISSLLPSNDNKVKNQNGELFLQELDLSSLMSVKKCAENILEKEPKINILVNSGGVFVPKEKFTKDGFESNFAVNYFSHFLFTLLLLPRIIDSRPARIVNVASIAFTCISSIDFDDFNFEKPLNPYFDMMAYGQSKLFVILFTRELAKRLNNKGINDVTVYSLHPGHSNTDITRNYSKISEGGYFIYKKIVGPLFLKTPKQGAQTIIHCAIDKNVENESGFFYRNCKIANLTKFSRNEDLDHELWSRSVNLLKNYFVNDFFMPKILED